MTKPIKSSPAWKSAFGVNCDGAAWLLAFEEFTSSLNVFASAAVLSA